MEMFMFENTKKKYSSVYPMLEEKGDKEAYQKFMQAALKKFGVESPADLSPEEKKKFFDYVDANWKGDNEKPEPEDKKEAYEEGTDEYLNHCKDGTPGQAEINQNEDNAKNLDEKAVSQQQQKLMGLAYAVKKGEIDAPSPEIQKIADSMSLEELKKMAEGKHKDLPVKKEVKEEDKVTNEKLDARRKMFREKIRKLAYEKAKKMVKSGKMEEKKEEKEKIKNKVTINPELKEHKGYDFAKKYYYKQKSINEDEQKVLNLLEANPFRFELAGTFTPAEVTPQVADGSIDGPASASLIAKTLKMSPMAVQEILDRAVRMGTITRVGDAYSYGKVEVQ